MSPLFYALLGSFALSGLIALLWVSAMDRRDRRGRSSPRWPSHDRPRRARAARGRDSHGVPAQAQPEEHGEVKSYPDAYDLFCRDRAVVRRQLLRAAGRCINGPADGYVSKRGTEHGPVARGGKCQRCCDLHRATAPRR